MEIHLQRVLYLKIKDLIRAHVGTNFGFKKEETGKTLLMLITNQDVPHLNKVREFLGTLGFEEYSREKMKKNHAGIAGTISISISLISKESIITIEDLHDKLRTSKSEKKAGKTTNEVFARDSVEPEISCNKEGSASTETKPVRCNKYEFSKYLKSVLRFEGLDHKSFNVKKDGEKLILCSKDPYVIKTAEEAINYYFGEQVANVYVGNDDHCISFLEAKEQSAQAKRFSFCSAPEEKENIQDIERRLNRVFSSKKYVIQKTKEGFDVNFQVKGLVELRFALIDMGWKIKDKDGGFSIVITRMAKTPQDLTPNTKPAHKPVQKTEKEEQSPRSILASASSDSKESLSAKEEAFKKLCELIESEDFNLLSDLLKERVLQKKEDYLKSKRREEVTLYVENLLAILD
jgi:hypothetical protein